MDTAWDTLSHQIALRFAIDATDEPNMEVKFAKDRMGQQALDDAWSLDLLGTEGRISDLSDQIAFKLYLSRGESGKDLEDAEHIAIVA